MADQVDKVAAAAVAPAAVVMVAGAVVPTIAMVAHRVAEVEAVQFVSFGQEIPVNSRVPALVHHNKGKIKI